MIRKIFSTIKNYKLSNLNFRLLIYVLAVTFIGIFCIGSATEGEEFQFKQILGFALGIIVLIIFTLLSYKFVFKFYWLDRFRNIYFRAFIFMVSTIHACNNG